MRSRNTWTAGKNTSLFFLIISILSLYNSTLFSQKIPIDKKEHEFFFEEVWTKELNRSLSSIESMVQTSDGYIWIATNNGLFRYNGDGFINYSGQNTPLFFNTLIQCLHEDKNKTLWIGTNKGLLYYEKGRFHFFDHDSILRNNPISAVCSDMNGNVFVGTNKLGLFKLENGRKDITSIRVDSHLEVNCLKCYNDVVWVGTSSMGVAKFVNNKMEFILQDSKIVNETIEVIQVDKKGNLWIATSNSGLVKYFNGKAKYYNKESGFLSNRILSVLENADGSFWVGTGGGSLVRLNGENIKIYNSQNGLTIDAIRSLLIDKEGTLWVGTGGGGLFRTKSELIKTYTTKDGLSDNYFWCTAQDHKGNIWLGTGDNGISIITKNGIRYLTKKDGLPADNIRTMFCDSKNRMWIGTVYDGVVLLDKGMKTYFNKKNGLHDNDTRAIFEDSKGRVWIATLGGCKYYYNGQLYDHSTILRNTPVPNRYITEDMKGTLYFGNGSSGVIIWDGKRVTRLTKKEGLISGDILSIYCDKESAVWIGTGKGLARYKYGKVLNVIYDPQISDHAVLNILEDNYGNMWLSTFIGIISINKSDINDYLSGKRSHINYRVFGKLDGMISTECNGANQNAGMKSRDGRLWFPTMNGIAVIDPDNIHKTKNHNIPPVVLDYFYVNDSNFNIFEKNIIIPPGSDKLEFIFSALSFTNPPLNRYKYMIEGLDHSWNDAGNKTSAIYNKVPPGDYTFRVIACNSDGVWNYEGVRIAFTIKPEFYETKWFVFLIILFVISLVFLVLYLRDKYNKKIRAYLERIISQKTEQLEKELKEKEKKEIELRENRDRLNFFVEGSKDGFWDWDLKSNNSSYNYRMEEVLGRKKDKFPNSETDWLNILHKDDSPKIVDAITKCFNGLTASFEVEFRIKTEEEKYKWIFARGKNVAWDNDGKPIRMAGSITDIDLRKKNEDEILKAKKIESIGLLAGGIAHDFNNLLTIILGNISLIRFRIHNHQEKNLETLVDNSEKASIRAKDLTQQLLTFSKGGEPIIKTISISKILRETSTFSLRGSNVKSHFDIPNDLWPIEADEGQINQVVQNIVINARQAMAHGGNIYISASNCVIDNIHDDYKMLPDGNYVQVRIKDTGPGIAKENVEKIFDPYFTTKISGHGLGLFTTYSIIRKHRGDIKLESEIGDGAEFIFWIPASADGVIAQDGNDILERGSGRVLILDDEPLIRNILYEMLTNLGYDVSATANGDETISEYKKSIDEKKPYELVIIDLTIPGGIGGVETTEKLKLINPKVRTLVSTGYSNDVIIANFKDYGFDGILNKPYVIEDVSNVVKKTILLKN